MSPRDEPLTMIISRERGFSSTDFGRSYGGAPPESRLISFALPPAEAPPSALISSETRVLNEAILAQRRIGVRSRRIWLGIRRIAKIAWTRSRKAYYWTSDQLHEGLVELRRQWNLELERHMPKQSPPPAPYRGPAALKAAREAAKEAQEANQTRQLAIALGQPAGSGPTSTPPALNRRPSRP